MTKIDVSARSAGSALLFLSCLVATGSAQATKHKTLHADAAVESASSVSLLVPADASIPSDVWNDPRWRQGPLTAQLGHVATLMVPAGFRYLPPLPARLDDDAPDAGEANDGSSDQSNDSLSAVIAPDDGSWTTRIALAYTGYIDTRDIDLNPDDLART
ncbi:hypothetical protein AB1286_20590, partial [Trinickia sp. NRRL B-1857]